MKEPPPSQFSTKNNLLIFLKLFICIPCNSKIKFLFSPIFYQIFESTTCLFAVIIKMPCKIENYSPLFISFHKKKNTDLIGTLSPITSTRESHHLKTRSLRGSCTYRPTQNLAPQKLATSRRYWPMQRNQRQKNAARLIVGAIPIVLCGSNS